MRIALPPSPGLWRTPPAIPIKSRALQLPSRQSRPGPGRHLFAAFTQGQRQGNMPASMAQARHQIGRKRLRAPPRPPAACAPSCRVRSANVTSKMAFAMATPTAIIAPMNDWMLSVEPQSHNASATPAITAGTADTAMIASRTD